MRCGAVDVNEERLPVIDAWMDGWMERQADVRCLLHAPLITEGMRCGRHVGLEQDAFVRRNA